MDEGEAEARSMGPSGSAASPCLSPCRTQSGHAAPAASLRVTVLLLLLLFMSP